MSKWIEFRELGEAGGRRVTKLFAVYMKDRAQPRIGLVAFYPGWRKYAFYPAFETLFEPTCLRDIAAFCEEQTQARKAARR